MRLGYHAPLPPAPTGVADYAATLARALSKHMEVAPDADSADVHLYQLGNNHLHRAYYEKAIRQPGAVLLHDANLHHFHLGTMSGQQYVEEFVAQYGEWYGALARDLWNRRATSASARPYFDFPMLKRVAQTARCVVVHSHEAARRVRAEFAGAVVHTIPHMVHAAPPMAAERVAEIRRGLGAGPKDCVFGVFGHLRETKRIRAILAAFQRARAIVPAARLLIAGEAVARDLERAISDAIPAAGVCRAGYLTEDAFWCHGAAIDVCINLRYPSSGESSGIAARMLALGKPLILSAGSEPEGLPPGSVFTVDPGPCEVEMLTLILTALASRREATAAAGAIARNAALANLSPEVIGQRFAGVLRNPNTATDPLL